MPHINYATASSLLFNTDYSGNKSVLTLWDLKSTWIMYQAFRPCFAILYPLWVTKTNTWSSPRASSLLSESHRLTVQRSVWTPSRYWGNRGITPLIFNHDTTSGERAQSAPRTGLEDSEVREIFRSYGEVILAPENYIIINLNQLRGHNKQLRGAHF
jgi:hypothetical protein